LSLCAASNVHWPERSGCWAHNGVVAALPRATTPITTTVVNLMEKTPFDTGALMSDIRARFGGG